MTMGVVLLLAASMPTAAALHALRAPPPRMCAEPIVSRETLAKVQSDLYRTSDSDADSAQALQEQSQLISSLLGDLANIQEQPQPPAANGASPPAAADPSSTEAAMNKLVAPHLPLLLGRSFPLAVRAVLPTIRTEEERSALLALSQFVIGVQEEIGDALTELQWRQQQKLRELCDAASEGGTERL